jgi:hypothetical protein
MANTNNKRLTFPQRNWFLLCVIVAILSPLVVHWVQAGARKRVYDQETQVRDTSRSGGAGSNDTSNKVASPPSNQPAGAAGGSRDSASKKTGGSATDTH